MRSTTSIPGRGAREEIVIAQRFDHARGDGGVRWAVPRTLFAADAVDRLCLSSQSVHPGAGLIKWLSDRPS